MARSMTGGDAVVAGLRHHGVDVLFGLPGIQLDGLFCALHDATSWLRVINARHEQGVAYMALGYAQATGRPGVYAAVPGPGFLNTTAALSTAYAVYAPVLALIGQIAAPMIGKGFGELHELPDQTAILRGLTRWSGLAWRPVEVPGLMAEAFGRLRTGLGPVGLELPADVLKQRQVVAPAPPWQAPDFPLDEDAVAAAVSLMHAARSPLILVGGGALAAGAAVERLSELLQAPVTSHLQGRGVVDSRKPLSISLAEAAKLWATSDLIVAIGTRLHEPRHVWGLRPGQKVIRVDIDPLQFLRGTKPDVAIAGDAQTLVTAMVEALTRGGLKRASRQDEMLRLKAAQAQERDRVIGPQMAYLRAIEEVLPQDAMLVADYTQVGYVAGLVYPARAPRQLISPGYQGTLGFSYATALGAKVACPDKTVVALVGDGGFLFTATELATAAQHDIRVIVVVFADEAYGNVKRMQEEDYGGRVIATDLRNPDFVRFAESFGVAAHRAAGPQALGEALRWAMAQPGPTLIEVPVPKFPNPWNVLEPVPD
jgi:acetolactate synthase-1/2/3 large subunit